MRTQLLKTLLLAVLFVGSNAFSQIIHHEAFDSSLGVWTASANSSTISYNATAGATALGALEGTVTASWRGVLNGTINMTAGANGTFNLSYKIRKVSGVGVTACKAYVKQGATSAPSTQANIASLPSITGADGQTWNVYSYDFTVTDNSQNLSIEIIVGGDANQSGVFLLDDINVNGPATLSVKSNTLEGVSIYPNPATSVVNINSVNGGAITVYNTLGTKVLTATATSASHQLNVSGLSSGVYLLELVSEGKTSVTKLVKK